MKKIFSLFAAVLMVGSMMAADYQKVTAAPTDWTGEYVLVAANNGATAMYAFTGVDAAPGSEVVTITDGKISNYTGVTISVVANGDAYALKVNGGDNDGLYMSSGSSAPSYSNALKFVADSAKHPVTLVMEGENVVMKQTTSSGDVTIRYNYASDQMRFRFYKSGQQPVQLYKKVEAPVVTPVVLTGAATAEAINITTESTGTWYGNVLSEAIYLQYKGLMGMSDSVIVQALADQNEAELYTGNKSFAIADLTFNDAALTPGKYYFVAGGLLTDDDPASMFGYINNGEPIVVEFTVAEPEPANCWDDLEWLGDGAQGGALSNKYKVCKPSNVGVVNIQNSFGTEAGIYVTFPEAGLSCDLGEGKYAVQGAGMLLYISAFTAKVTEVVVTSAAGTYNLTVFYVDGQDAPAPTGLTFEVAQNGDEFTITPSNNTTEYYIWIFGEDEVAEMEEQGVTIQEVFGMYVAYAGPTDVFTGVVTQSLANDWYNDEPGKYYLCLVAVAAGEDDVYAAVGDITVEELTIAPAGATIDVVADNTARTLSAVPSDNEVVYMFYIAPTTGTYAANKEILLSYVEEDLSYIEGPSDITQGIAEEYYYVGTTVVSYDDLEAYGTDLCALAVGIEWNGTAAVMCTEPTYITFTIPSTPTAIDNVEAGKVIKTIENGQVVIIRDGIRYNAVGAKL